MKEKTKRIGRTPKLSSKTHYVMVRFDDEKNARFLTMYEQSGEYTKVVVEIDVPRVVIIVLRGRLFAGNLLMAVRCRTSSFN